MSDFLHGALTKRIIGVFYDVYNELGFGFLECIYQRSLEIAFREHDIQFRSQVPITVWYHGQQVGRFFADLFVEDAVIVELKACRVLEPSHATQVLNYLRATDVEVGLLLNFGEKPDFKRMAFSNGRKRGRR